VEPARQHQHRHRVWEKNKNTRLTALVRVKRGGQSRGGVVGRNSNLNDLLDEANYHSPVYQPFPVKEARFRFCKLQLQKLADRGLDPIIW
jgi:hypothetical protein